MMHGPINLRLSVYLYSIKFSQSGRRLTKGWITRFLPGRLEDFSLRYHVQTDPVVYPVYPRSRHWSKRQFI